MKAYVLEGINEFHRKEVDKPSLGAGEVLVKVKAAGICGSDIPRVYRTGTYHYPLILGHEFAGEVTEVGAGVDQDRIGKRVGVFPLIPCRECAPCKKEQYEMCQKYSYLGSRQDGGFAEYVAVPEWNLLELPENVSYKQAAMLEPMAVALHCIRKCGAAKRDTVAVCGLGTIGLFVVMFLKQIGCNKILGIGNKAFQKNVFLNLGIESSCYCDSKSEDAMRWISDATDGNGVDVFFECVGKNDTITMGIDSVAAGGKLQLVGNPADDMMFPQAVYWKLLRKQISVFGTWNSTFMHCMEDDWNSVLAMLSSGHIHPEKMITHELGADDLISGFELMRDKKEDYVKVMWLPEE